MSATLPYTGERVVPEAQEGDPILAEHLLRYIFSRQLVKGKTVLDVACGSGYGSRMLSEAGATTVYGVDIDERTIRYAEAHYGAPNIRFRRADAQHLPFEKHMFDVAVSFESIEHVRDATQFLREVKRVLRPDGILLLSTPNKTTSQISNPFHAREFTIEETTSLLDHHFRHTALFSQFLNLASFITDPAEWNGTTKNLNSVPLFALDQTSAGDCLYSVVIASDATPPSVDTRLCGIVFRPTFFRSWVEMVGMRVQREELALRLQEKDRVITSLTKQLGDLTSSMSWKLTWILRTLKRVLQERTTVRSRTPHS